MIIELIILFIIIILIVIFFKKWRADGFANVKKIFKAPMSKTRIFKNSSNNDSTTNESTPSPFSLEEDKGLNVSFKELEQLSLKFPKDSIDYNGNEISFPGFFHVNEKWPGCLPRPLFQGTCGSCWGFASVTALSSRFYIESCGVAGCMNYPQINFGSLNQVYNNINEVYKFRKLYLTNVFKYIDIDRSKTITKPEWISAIEQYYELFNNTGTPFTEKHYIVQVLTYILDFQSLGSVNLFIKDQVLQRANEVFDIWIEYTDKNDPKDMIEIIFEDEQSHTQSPLNPLSPTQSPTSRPTTIDIVQLEEKWKTSPVNLSAEKIIACCVQCVINDFTVDSNNDLILKDTKNTTKELEAIDLICVGGSLEDAWNTLKTEGTPTALCVGYNMDSYVEGDVTPTCKTIQGPYYSFCSGYAILDKDHTLEEEIKKFEESGVNPISIPDTSKNLPWIDPQLFIFRAKNVYKIKSDQYSIQREILERGPVTTGFEIYPDFQYAFASEGLGGQMFDGKNPLGSTSKSLIYKWSGKGTSLGGHAIVIVGWGTYVWTSSEGVSVNIPYWICLNSWGYNWGTSGFANLTDRNKEPYRLKKGGYFWILRGTNECSIEENVIVGQPDLENISYPGIVQQYGWGLPSPDTSLVEYVSQKSENILPNGTTFIYKNTLEGGSTYISPELPTMNSSTSPTESPNVKYDWVIKSMTPPSPFTLFWDQDRPIFCLGKINEKIFALNSDNIVITDNETINKLKLCLQIQKNPLFIMNEEQLQVHNIINEISFSVFRAVNNSILMTHNIGTIMKIIPFKSLSVNLLSTILQDCSKE